MADHPIQTALEEKMRLVAEQIRSEIGDDSVKFLLMLFDSSEFNFMAYASSVEREGGFTAILEWMVRMDRPRAVAAFEQVKLMETLAPEAKSNR